MFGVSFKAWGGIALVLALVAGFGYHKITVANLERGVSDAKGQLGQAIGKIESANAETTKANTAVTERDNEIALHLSNEKKLAAGMTSLQKQGKEADARWKQCMTRRATVQKVCSTNESALPKDYLKGVSDEDYAKVIDELNALTEQYNARFLREGSKFTSGDQGR